MSDEIMVSIVCQTYNHEKYIRDALDSFIAQKTSFKYEILVHDDASTDLTPVIIKEYEKLYPDIVKPIYQKRNQYSQGIPIGLTYQYPRARGKYIAFCEGDDFWCDDEKLQMQYDVMEKHPELDMCAHAAKTLQDDTFGKEISPHDSQCIMGLEEIIEGGGGYVATNTLFFRTCMFQDIPPFYRNYTLDYLLQIWGAIRGGIMYLPEAMSVYRIASTGSWTVAMRKNVNQFIAHRENIKTSLQMFNEETHYQYDENVKKIIKKMDFDSLYIQGMYKEMKKPQYTDLYQKLSPFSKIKIVIKAIVRRVLNYN